MMQRQEQFQQDAQQQMAKAQNDAMAPIYQKLDNAIKAVGAAEGVIYILTWQELRSIRKRITEHQLD